MRRALSFVLSSKDTPCVVSMATMSLRVFNALNSNVVDSGNAYASRSSPKISACFYRIDTEFRFKLEGWVELVKFITGCHRNPRLNVLKDYF